MLAQIVEAHRLYRFGYAWEGKLSVYHVIACEPLCDAAKTSLPFAICPSGELLLHVLERTIAGTVLGWGLVGHVTRVQLGSTLRLRTRDTRGDPPPVQSADVEPKCILHPELPLPSYGFVEQRPKGRCVAN